MNYRRNSAGICQWNGNIVVVGGYNGESCKKAEYYDFHKNEWFELPETNTTHRNCCCVMIYKDGNPYFELSDGVVMVVGDDGIGPKENWGWIEYYDHRDSKRKWNLVKQVSECIDCDTAKNDFLDFATY